MKKQKISSALRRKIQHDDQATAYSVNKQEMLDLIQKIMLDNLTDEEKKKLAKPFKFFTGCSIDKEEYSYLSYTRPNSLFAHQEVLIWTAHDVYELKIPWLCAGGFKKKLKQLLK